MSLDRPAPHALRSGTPTVRAALEGMQTSPCESFDPPPHQPISVHPLAHLSAPHPHATNKHAHTCRTHARTRTLSLTHTHTHTHTHARTPTHTHTHTHARTPTHQTDSQPTSQPHTCNGIPAPRPVRTHARAVPISEISVPISALPRRVSAARRPARVGGGRSPVISQHGLARMSPRMQGIGT